MLDRQHRSYLTLRGHLQIGPGGAGLLHASRICDIVNIKLRARQLRARGPKGLKRGKTQADTGDRSRAGGLHPQHRERDPQSASTHADDLREREPHQTATDGHEPPALFGGRHPSGPRDPVPNPSKGRQPGGSQICAPSASVAGQSRPRPEPGPRTRHATGSVRKRPQRLISALSAALSMPGASICENP